MNIRRLTKIITVLMFLATIALAVSTVFASSQGAKTIEDITSKMATPTDGNVTNPVTSVLNIVSYICYVAAIILLIMLGIKYMTAAPEGKAEIKKMAITYVIGAVLVFAAGVVLMLISRVSENALKTS